MISHDFVAAFSRHWIEAWKRHDLDDVIQHMPLPSWLKMLHPMLGNQNLHFS